MLELLGSFFGLFLLVVIAAILFSAIFIVHQQEVALVERLGKFHKIAHPGLNFKIPFVDSIRTKVNLRVLQLMVEVDTKTKDNVFVRIPVAVQYKVIPGKEQESFYSLGSSHDQITSYVQDNVRTSLASMNLDQAFESKDEIAQHVETVLSEKMSGYGWNIVNTLVTDIQIMDQQVVAAMNEINASQRKREAAIALAEAEKIRMVKAAEGEAEARRLQGVGIANERKAIVEGFAEQVKLMRMAGLEGDPQGLLIQIQYLDTMKDMAKSGKSSVMFMPSNLVGEESISDSVRNSILSTDMLRKDNDRIK